MLTQSTIITSVKILLLSTLILVTTLLLSPILTSFSSTLPAIWTVIKSYLRPPYLYVIINCIIITIVASSRLHHSHHDSNKETETHAPPVHKVVLTRQHDVISVKDVDVVFEEQEEEVKEIVNIVIDDEVEEFKWTPSPLPPTPLVRQEAMTEFLSKRPPAVSRFGHHRRAASKGSPIEGVKALRRVAKPKKQETLESTWKAITEGRHIPLTRHLKRSDTLESHDRQIDLLDSSPPLDHVKKSKTFTDRTNYTSTPVMATTKLKKEPSLGQDELNRRVEAFINKFNEDMRLQRQQSMQQFMEMINRAA